MLSNPVLDRLIAAVDSCPYGTAAGRKHRSVTHRPATHRPVSARVVLYSPEEKRRRDATPWTMVQGILAPAQFLVFMISLGLVIRYLGSGEGLALAEASIVIKTVFLFAIMITGCVWEHAVFGKYLFAPAFFWEDVFSLLVMALHTAYVAALIAGWGDTHFQMWLALAAYSAYVINATQFVLKLRAARLQAHRA